MNKEDLINRLLSLDFDASLKYDKTKGKINCFIVGGGALILMGYIPRATHDIDIINKMPKEITPLMSKYDMNINAISYYDHFADDFYSRAIKLDLNTEIIDYYTLSLEDLVVSKLASGRLTDEQDINQPSVVNNINWDKLDELVNLTIEGMISDFRANELKYFYNEYRKKYGK